MRFLPFTVFLLLTSLSAHSQEQERKLVDRILKPNTSLGAAEQTKAYYGGQDFHAAAGGAQVKEFRLDNHVRIKDYAAAPFSGTKSWAGDFKFSASSANTSTQTIIPNANKAFETKATPVKEASESAKTYDSHGTYAVRDYQIAGKSQKLFDYENANRKAMTIDDVRELLNKNK